MSQDVKKMTVEEMQREAIELDLKIKRLQAQDLRESIDGRQLTKDDRYQRFKSKGDSIRQTDGGILAAQNRCNHRKGGNGMEAVVGGKGDDNQYAIGIHQKLNADKWVFCLRCHKTWKPPIKMDFVFEVDDKGSFIKKNGKFVPVIVETMADSSKALPTNASFNEAEYDKAKAVYEAALQFPTRNVESSEGQFGFRSTDPNIDAIEWVRESWRFVNLN